MKHVQRIQNQNADSVRDVACVQYLMEDMNFLFLLQHTASCSCKRGFVNQDSTAACTKLIVAVVNNW